MVTGFDDSGKCATDPCAAHMVGASCVDYIARMRGGIILGAAVLPLMSPASYADKAEPVCPLTDKQQKDATQAFSDLSPIFREPRCFNCHGGVSPFGDGRGLHPVSHLKLIRDSTGTEDFQATFAQCEECHEIKGPGPAPKWRLAPFAPEDKRWINVPGFAPKTSLQICVQQKALFAGKAAHFVAHMDNDDGGTPFLDVAFKGDMALTPDGVNQLSQGVNIPEPPRSMGRREVLKHSKDWVEAQGGEFHEPDECGCVRMDYALRVKFHGVFAPTIAGAVIHFDFDTLDSTAAPALIPLHFQDGGLITGSGTLAGGSAGTITSQPASCQTNGGSQVGVTVNGIWPALQSSTNPQAVRSDPSASKLEIQLNTRLLGSTATGECVDFLGRVYRGSSDKAGPGVYSLNFSLEPIVGATQTVPWNVPLPGWSGEVQATLVRTK